MNSFSVQSQIVVFLLSGFQEHIEKQILAKRALLGDFVQGYLVGGNSSCPRKHRCLRTVAALEAFPISREAFTRLGDLVTKETITSMIFFFALWSLAAPRQGLTASSPVRGGLRLLLQCSWYSDWTSLVSYLVG
jgi:hypothetical protein